MKTLEITKRAKYVIFSILFGLLAYYYSAYISEFSLTFLIFMVLISIAGNFIVHAPNYKISNILITSILQLHLLIGLFLSFEFFPNLSLMFKAISILVFGVIFYIVLVVNNVFLVVASRNEIIPLYRVAVTWSKILLVTIAIPFYAGIFKLPVDAYLQTLLVTFSYVLFGLYLLWFFSYSKETKKYKVGEIITILGFGSFVLYSLSICVSFFPSESFLRALFIASVLMFNVSYLEGHFKNKINKKLLSEHILISVLFFILVLIFKP